MNPITFGKVVVDRCRQCRGLWLDKGEFEALKELDGSEKIDAGPPVDLTKIRLNTVMRCVKDNARLDPKKKSGVQYDQCPQCGGIFLDAGEFTSKKSAKDSGGIGSFLSGLFGK